MGVDRAPETKPVDPEQGDQELPLETNLVRFQRSPIHGLGGFAKTAISPGMRIIEYVGELISKAQSLERCEAGNHYIFYLSDQQDIDGRVPWNPARFINHSCAPNCDAELLDGQIWIVARRHLAPGEEITFNYGYDLEDFRDYPCCCGSPDCLGFMVAEEYFETVKQKRSA